MKTTLNQKFETIEQLNKVADTGVSHIYLRGILIGKKYYNPKKHDKGAYFIEDTGSEKMLYIADHNLFTKKYNYVLFHSVKKVS